MKSIILTATLFAFSSLAARSHAEDMPRANQGALVHVDTPDLIRPGGWRAFLEGRIFGGDEDIAYVGVGAHYGLTAEWETGVRAVLADRKSLPLPGGNAIAHGGNDLELLVRYGRKDIAGQIGLSFADTPAQRDTFFTLGASGRANLGSRAAAFLNPRAVLIDGNTIVGIGIGGEIHLSGSVALAADWTPIVAGENTRDTTTGDRKRRDVYGAALRFTTADGRTSLDVGYANGTGRTTGASLTPGLGGSGAFYVSLRVSR